MGMILSGMRQTMEENLKKTQDFMYDMQELQVGVLFSLI